MKKNALFIAFLFITTQAMAATGDFLENIGKIYVVVAVILVIFIGIIIYLIRLENKIKKLEKIIEDEQ